MADLFEHRDAIFSECRTYRYILRIIWNLDLPVLVAVMLNPSAADEFANDPTVERVCRRAKKLGFGGVIVLNAFAYRETDRLKMLKVADPVGPENDIHITGILRAARAGGWTVFAGWGADGGHRGRDRQVLELCRRAGVELQCLRLTKDGQPQHPLYIGYDQPFMAYQPQA
jgi:hypothetical protein